MVLVGIVVFVELVVVSRISTVRLVGLIWLVVALDYVRLCMYSVLLFCMWKVHPRDSSTRSKAREGEPLTGTGTGNILDPLR